MTDRINVFADGDTYPSASYGQIVQTFGSIVAEASDDDYQGDSLYLIESAGRGGILTFGWGSCSGCDALESALFPYEEAQQSIDSLQDDLERGIRWFDSLDEARAWILGEEGAEFYKGSYLREELVADFKKAAAA